MILMNKSDDLDGDTSLHREKLQATILINDIKPAAERVSRSTGEELICSYNWVANAEKPTIYTPGSPPVWAHATLERIPGPLPYDTGPHNIDANAAHCPESPFEVAFRAAEVTNPHFSFRQVDVVINRNSLRKLYSLCREASTPKFRVNLFLVKDALIVERCERHAVGEEPVHKSCGKSFEKEMTDLRPGMLDSECHHRMIRYDFGGLNCAVRFEVDACRADDFDLDDTPSPATPTLATQAPESRIMVIERGDKGIAQDCLIEIKTTSHQRGRISPSSILPQLWFGRTQHVMQGLHHDRVFDRVSYLHVEPMFDD